ncbi:MAG: CDGSH iron-sulfur domain-containing protein [Verrucomicrobia bacterium]|nr:MAG: CDGSH iron-sulfur domain-containing protein [Verrucomicrobiota bacterium]
MSQNTQPCRMEMEQGIHWWCACGLSSHGPFCDGSHKGTGKQPVRVEILEKKSCSWCMCKRSQNAPFCDGSHRVLAPPH